MIYKKIYGRLGNQMFQYAVARAYAEKYGEELGLDFNGVRESGFEVELLDFNIKQFKEQHEFQGTIWQNLLIKVMKAGSRIYAKDKDRGRALTREHRFQKRMAKIMMQNGIYWLNQGYMEILPSKAKNKMFWGIFESAKFFQEYDELIREEFTPKHSELEKNKKLYEAIRESESVCVTIRRGDFLSDEFKTAHYVCTEKYFERGIQKVQEEAKVRGLPKLRFFVFSDDVEWVKKNMKFPKGTAFESGDDPIWEKMRLMYSCKHFIISNSTFSWWAQHLSRNPGKMVVAPSIWKNVYQNDDIYEEGWILVNPKEEQS